jgi:hypothetical protein
LQSPLVGGAKIFGRQRRRKPVLRAELKTKYKTEVGVSRVELETSRASRRGLVTDSEAKIIF